MGDVLAAGITGCVGGSDVEGERRDGGVSPTCQRLRTQEVLRVMDH